MENGDMSVITVGMMLMLKLFVSSWVIQHHVSSVIINSKFQADSISRPSSYYGYGNGTIWLDYLHCRGSETKLINCRRGVSIGATDCGYNEMAGVFCACKKKTVALKMSLCEFIIIIFHV